MSLRRLLLLSSLSLAVTGCEVSSQDVMITEPAPDADARSLSVAWAAMEARISHLEASVELARQETAMLCADAASASNPICQRLATTENRVAEHADAVVSLDVAMESVGQRVEYNERTLSPMDYDPSTKTVTLTGVNLQVRNGTGSTAGEGDGTGNLIVGWNEQDDNDNRDGSHNVVIGSFHAYENHSGLAVGVDHALLGDGGAVLGGEANTVAGAGSVVVGGQDNSIFGMSSVVAGGAEQEIEEDLICIVNWEHEDLGDAEGVIYEDENYEDSTQE
ncbi:MAG: hypothetical protein KDA24_15980 [Deltaproteobacteria bacterium]|nr:hypothetical protein [Deltaproteobacteria bacterium]